MIKVRNIRWSKWSIFRVKKIMSHYYLNFCDLFVGTMQLTEYVFPISEIALIINSVFIKQGSRTEPKAIFAFA
jgi:hypothetical protein